MVMLIINDDEVHYVTSISCGLKNAFGSSVYFAEYTF
jgi:hypothetical protein